MAGATIGGTDTTGDVAILTGQNLAVFSAVGTGAPLSFGGNADMSTFSEAVGAASVYGGGGADTFDFADAVGAATIDLGAGADSLVFSGAVPAPPSVAPTQLVILRL